MTNYVSHRVRFIAVVAFCLVFAVAATAQFSSSRITGTVTDATGAVIPGATVTVTNEATGVSDTTTTSVVGTYVFDAMQIGTYTVEIETQGFKKFVSKSNKLSITRVMTVNAAMEIGQTTEVVEVTSSAIAVVTDSSGNFGNLVSKSELEDLPIIQGRGNSPLGLIYYQPGVSTGGNTGGGTHVNGSRDRSWNYTLDGVDVNESSTGGSETTPLRLNAFQLEEFRVVTGGQTAEYGRNSGGQVTMVSRSGTSDFHGDAFYQYQSAGLDAHSWTENRLGLGKGKFIQHMFGANLGGPVVPDGKTFFHVNYQGLRSPRSGLVTSTVHTAQARTGIFEYVTSPCLNGVVRNDRNECIDASGNLLAGITSGTYNMVAEDPRGIGLDAQTMAFINLTPLPNNFTECGDGLNTACFVWQAPGGEEQTYLNIKVNHDINDNNRVWGRFSYGDDVTLGDRVNGGNARYPGLPRVVDTGRFPRNSAFGLRSTPTTQITNEFVLGFNFFTYDFGNPDPNFATNPPFVMNLMTDPLHNFVGNLREPQTTQIVDNLTFVQGAHTFKGGVNFRFLKERDRRASVGGANASLAVNFSAGTNNPYTDGGFYRPTNAVDGINDAFDQPRLASMINDMLGRVGTMSQGFVANADGTAFDVPGSLLEFVSNYDELDFYLQDSWKIKPNLLLEFGFRYEIKAAPTTNNRQILVPNQGVFAGAPSSDTMTWVPGKLWQSDGNFSPLVGFAWDPNNDGKMSIRGNARIAYDRMNPFVVSSRVHQSLPGQVYRSTDVDFGSVSDGRVSEGLPSLLPTITPADGLQPEAFSTNGNTVFAPDWEAPETYMWGLSFQRDLGNGLVFDATYNGRYGKNLIGAYDANQPNIRASGVPGDPGCTETFLEAFIYTQNPANDQDLGSPNPPSCLFNALLSSISPNGTDWVQDNFATTLAWNNVASLADYISDRIRSGVHTISASGFPSNYLEPFPQYFGFMWVIDSKDYSHYHGLTMQVKGNMAQGLNFTGSYTLSKSMDTRSYDPTFTVVSYGTNQSSSSSPFDIFNRDLNYARSDFDRRHALNGNWIYELPFGQGKAVGGDMEGWMDNIIGGWSISGLTRWTSGRPMTVYGRGYTMSHVVRTPANCAVADCHKIKKDPHIAPDGVVYFFEKGSGDINFITAAPGEFSTLGRNAFSGPSFFVVDAALIKEVKISESQSIEFNLQMTDATNHSQWGLPTDEIYSSLFGRLRDPSSSHRRYQFYLKYSF